MYCTLTVLMEKSQYSTVYHTKKSDSYTHTFCTLFTPSWVSSITMVMTIDPGDWLELILELVGFDKSRVMRRSMGV